MTTFRPKLWTGVGAAVLLTAGLGLEACSQPDGVVKTAALTSSSGAAPAQAAGEGGEGGSEGGGEAGAQAAFSSIPNGSKPALRLAQLKGFLLIALKQPDGAEAAGVLLSQGLSETLDKNPASYKGLGLDESLLRKAAKTGAQADLKASQANIEAAQMKAGGDPLAITKGLVDIASGLYQGAVKPDMVDPVDYQHSLGAALAAQQILDAQDGKDRRATAAKAQLDKFVALWPQAKAPDKPTPASAVVAQASRVELELS